MKAPDIKGILSKLSFLRNNIALLVPILIAVVAGVLLIPTGMISARLRRNIETESVSKGRKIASLLRDVVPTEAIKQVEEYQKAYTNDANQIELLAKRTTQRALLSYRLFPEPKSTSILIFEEFGRLYRGAIEKMIADLGSGDRPTPAEIKAALDSSATRTSSSLRSGYTPYAPTIGPGSGRSETAYGYGMMGEIDRKITDEICTDRAKSARIYAIAGDLAGYDFWAGYKFDTGLDQAVKDCWYWQLGCWIVEDVVTTVKNMNAGSNSVFTSPVKRLITVNFDLTRKGFGRPRRVGMMGRARREGGGTPIYVTGNRVALTLPCTGRLSKDETGIDVVHFNVAAVVSANAVLPFMDELCSAKGHNFRGIDGQGAEQTFKHNQITILESSVAAVERDSLAHGMFRYGDEAVVELDMICEYVFNRTGNDEIKPEVVKQDLAAAAETKTR